MKGIFLFILALVVVFIFGLHTFSVQADSCPTVKPGPDWICYNGGWYPPDYPGIPTPTPEPTVVSTPVTTSTPSCPSVKPGPDWTCVNGGWLPPDYPTATITATITANPNPITYNTASTATWSSTNVTSCAINGVGYPTSGSDTTGPLTSSATYTLNCTGPYGPASASVTVNVNSAPLAPTAAITVSGSHAPASVPSGSIVTVAWSSTNANFCQVRRGDATTTGSIAWEGTTGAVNTPILSYTRFRLYCQGNISTDAFDQASVDVIAKTIVPTPVPPPTEVPITTPAPNPTNIATPPPSTATPPPTPTATPPPAINVADINRDGQVNRADYDVIVSNFGKTGPNDADLNGDQRVDIFDYNELVENYGK